MDSTASHIMQIEIFMVQQFLFERQWQRIRTYAQKLGISIMGDMPIYVGYHSADVWANRKSFLLVCLLFVPKQYWFIA
jgi:4-alpha-glucanotransferase